MSDASDRVLRVSRQEAEILRAALTDLRAACNRAIRSRATGGEFRSEARAKGEVIDALVARLDEATTGENDVRH